MANPGTTVASLTVAALIGVGALAWKAADSAPDDRRAAVSQSSPAPAPPGQPQAPATPTQPPVPANSGTGMRVVYSVGQNLVWLVDANEKVPRYYKVAPGSVLTPVGTYRVQGKTPGPQNGGDGLKIVYTVRIGSAGSVIYGFSGTDTPLDDIMAANAPQPSGTRKPTGKTTTSPRTTTGSKKPNAGVRETVDDSKALYEFVDVGTSVVVVA